jgi:LysM repeat protein
MDDRGPSEGRTRRQAGRTTDRPTGRRGYAFPRGEHRQPGYSNQARRESRQAPYIIGFVVVVAALAAFLYVGLNWATGPGRAASLATPPTLTPVAVVAPTPAAAPTPTVGASPQQTYVVKAGDSPTSIAKQFQVKTDDLMTVNNIQDPSKLQIGQVLKIPPAASTTP